MKNINFLSMAAIAMLMVVAVGCTTMQGAQDDGYYDTRVAQTAPSRIYVEDPNRYGRTIVMERDPFTGRYYEVNPYGSVYNQGYSTYPYDPRYDNRVSNNRRYDSRRSNSGYSNRGQVYQQQSQQPTEEQRRESEQKRQDAKNAILGKKN
ncbi:MAG: hypothetical protein JWP88_375 [Flaviaesturariibacter sp.]|nr:hypothetical protein [Flaviaesturariibacter sp.]